MKENRVFALGLTTALSTPLLTDYGTGDTQTILAPEGSTPMEAGTTGAANELNVYSTSESETMDLSMNRTMDGNAMATYLFEGLYRWVDSDPFDNGHGGTIAVLESGMAIEEPTVTPNGDGTYAHTFRLREDVKWSDDQPMTTNDFVYSWCRLVDSATAFPYSTIIVMVKNASEIVADELLKEELSAATPNRYTFEVTLTYSCLCFLDICVFPNCTSLHEDITKDNVTWTQDPSTYVINGVFKMASWTHDVEVVMVLNENYYDASNITLEKLAFKLMDDANAQLTTFKNSDLDYMQNPPLDEMATLLIDGTMIPGGYLGNCYACLNNAKEPLSGPLACKAFSLAIDRSCIVEQVTQAGKITAGAWVPVNVVDIEGTSGDDFHVVDGSYWSIFKDDYGANYGEAQKLLAEADYGNDVSSPGTTYLYNTGDKHQTVVKALQSMWKDILGVEAILNNQDQNVFLETRSKGDYSICRSGWVIDYNDPISFPDMLMIDSGNNDTHYPNAGCDTIMTRVLSDSDAAGRMELVHQAEDLLVGEDQATAPLYYYSQPYVVAGDVRGIYYTLLGNLLFFHAAKGQIPP